MKLYIAFKRKSKNGKCVEAKLFNHYKDFGCYLKSEKYTFGKSFNCSSQNIEKYIKKRYQGKVELCFDIPKDIPQKTKNILFELEYPGRNNHCCEMFFAVYEPQFKLFGNAKNFFKYQDKKGYKQIEYKVFKDHKSAEKFLKAKSTITPLDNSKKNDEDYLSEEMIAILSKELVYSSDKKILLSNLVVDSINNDENYLSNEMITILDGELIFSYAGYPYKKILLPNLDLSHCDDNCSFITDSKNKSIKNFKTIVAHNKANKNLIAELDNKSDLVVYTDGSYNHKEKRCGSGLVFIQNNRVVFEHYFSFLDTFGNNSNVSEVMAILEALKIAKENGFKSIKIVCDYDCLKLWLIYGKAKKARKLKDYYISHFMKYSKDLKVEMVVEKSHRSKMNKRVDKLAKKACGL